MKIVRVDRCGVSRDVERVAVCVARCFVVEVPLGDGCVDVYTCLEPFVRREGGVDTSSHSLVVAGDDVSLLVGVAEGGIDIELAGGHTTGHGVVLTVTCALDGVEPVEVIIDALPLGDELAVGIEQCRVRSVVDVQLGVVGDEVLCGVGSGGGSVKLEGTVHSVVSHSCPGHLHPLVRVEGLIFRKTAGVNTLVDLHSDGWVCRATAALRGDENDSVGGAVAVKRGRRRILQDGNACDVSRVDLSDIPFKRSSIDNEQRFVGSVHGTESADSDCRGGSRLTVGVVDLHARCGSFQSSCG